ncbi:MAG: hypothetical protein D3923_03515, partial [Candidatus Electrothrix sp. AR3]|nr:hypothetical protein [Candidatus Electrothrix sp. AR3]
MPFSSTRYHVCINRTSLQVSHHGKQGESIRHKLSPGNTLTIKGKEISLAQLSNALINHDEEWLIEHLDERGQLKVGQYLYAQIFGTTSPYDLAESEVGVEVRICTEDEDIARLPWVLLAHEEVFLASMGWAVSLATSSEGENCELPPRPKILVVAPQAEDCEETEAEEHLQDFQELLTAADLTYGDASHFRSVVDYPSLLAELSSFCPDILYYYGHGVGNQHTSRLIFADQQGYSIEIPLSDLAAALQNLSPQDRPLLAYINCCQGDSGGLLGVGRQLLGLIP